MVPFLSGNKNKEKKFNPNIRLKKLTITSPFYIFATRLKS